MAIGRKLKGPMEWMLTQAVQPNHSAYRAQERQKQYYNQQLWVVMYQEGVKVWIQIYSQSWAEDTHVAKLTVQWKGLAKVVMKKRQS